MAFDEGLAERLPPPAAETPASICRFWFGTTLDDDGKARDAATVAAAHSKLWWRKQPETDRAIRQRFATTLARAAAGELDAWAATPQGRLALILVTDQFPRNIHRHSAQAFAYDPLARAWCLDGLACGADMALRPIERVFFYLPLEHSESLPDQDRGIALFDALAAQADAKSRPPFDDFATFARRHRDVIARFGRFPHRNESLGRRSTDVEVAFLREPGSSF